MLFIIDILSIGVNRRSTSTIRLQLGGVVQWLGRWSLAGGLSLIYA